MKKALLPIDTICHVFGVKLNLLLAVKDGVWTPSLHYDALILYETFKRVVTGGGDLKGTSLQVPTSIDASCIMVHSNRQTSQPASQYSIYQP